MRTAVQSLLSALGTDAETVLTFVAVGAIAVGVVVAGARAVSAIRRNSARARLRAFTPAFVKDVVRLYAFPRWSKGPNYSTPCFKVELFLRLAKIPYVIQFTTSTDASPTERLPFIVHNGNVIADSEFIIQYLTKKFDVKLDAHLSDADHALGLAARRQCETWLSWGAYRAAAVDNKPWLLRMIAKEFRVNRVLAWVIGNSMRKSVIHTLNTIGHGDLTDEQYRAEMLRDYKGIEQLVGAKKFLLPGDAPSSYDCAVAAMLQVQLNFDIDGVAALKFLRESRVLTGYVARVMALAFPDVEKLCQPSTAKFEDFTTVKA